MTGQFNPHTVPRPEIRKRDVVVRTDTEQPRGVVLMSPFPIEDADLKGVRTAPIDPGWYVLVMWHGRRRPVAELGDGLTRLFSLESDE